MASQHWKQEQAGSGFFSFNKEELSLAALLPRPRHGRDGFMTFRRTLGHRLAAGANPP
jgi:hypothetical protein